MTDIITALQDHDHKRAHALLQELVVQSAAGDTYYDYLEEFAALLTDKNAYVRTRGFLLCCAQARWDTAGRLPLEAMLPLLHDEKPTVVRQCLAALHEVVLYRPERCVRIQQELERMELSRYKDSMAPLIRRDMDELYRAMA